jgi:NAD(P)-dependent dehydrogenase (short-subunit alcohol dehydrogenase family)
MSETAVIAGVGALAGLGAAVAREYARTGLHVVLVGRTAGRLERVSDAIRHEGGSATACFADANSAEDMSRALQAAEAIGPIRAAVYNAGGNRWRPTLETDERFFEDIWRVNCLAGFMFGREVVKLMLPRSAGSLIFTGASASLRGRPRFIAFAAAKAGLRAIAQSLAREFGPLGIHVAHVVIDGAIDGERINRALPSRKAELPPGGMLDLEAIARVYRQVHEQHGSAWTHELDLRPYCEVW